MSSQHRFEFTGNGATRTTDFRGETLDYRIDTQATKLLNINFDKFASSLVHVPDRVLDLLEIAAYVFAADRLASRGKAEAVEFHSWARDITMTIRVRDHAFWMTPKVQEDLSKCLTYITGDNSWTFGFEAGHSSGPMGLFDEAGHDLSENLPDSNVALFSGGADSLAGVLELLHDSNEPVVLVSHQSSPQATRTQRAIVHGLKELFGDRIYHYPFETNVKGQRPVEETQRTRAFLFCSIGFALAFSLKRNELKVFENGVTSINLHRREDLMNARASRTTNPKAINLIQRFLETVQGSPFTISLPLLSQTKSDIIEMIIKMSPKLLSSTVSCTRPSFDKGTSTHCGTCFQCVDRRLGVYAQGKQAIDLDAAYSVDIARDPMTPSSKTVSVDFVRQALSFLKYGPDLLYDKYSAELAELLDHIPYGKTETEKVEWMWNLYRRHGDRVREGIGQMRSLHDDVFSSPPENGSFLSIVADRTYLRPDADLLLERIETVIQSFGEIFVTERPKNEHDLNQKLGTWLRSHDNRFRSEFPTTSFACAQVIPDHQLSGADVLIEAKYIRSKTTPSVATEGISSDLTKYPREKSILFVVYDPDHMIKSDDVFRRDIESQGRNRVAIVR